MCRTSPCHGASLTAAFLLSRFVSSILLRGTGGSAARLKLQPHMKSGFFSVSGLTPVPPGDEPLLSL